MVRVHDLPLSLYLPSRTKLLFTLQLRGQIHTPYFFSTPICTLCGVHSKLLENSAQPGGGVQAHPLSLYLPSRAKLWCPLLLIWQMHSSSFSSIPFSPFLCTFQLVVAEKAVVSIVLAIQPRRGLRTSVQEASAAEDNQSNHLEKIG